MNMRICSCTWEYVISYGNRDFAGVIKFVLVAQSCLTLCCPMSYSPLDSSVRGVLQAGMLEWVVIPFSRGSS